MMSVWLNNRSRAFGLAVVVSCGLFTGLAACGEEAAVPLAPVTNEAPAEVKNTWVQYGLSYPPFKDPSEFEITRRQMEALNVRLFRYEEHWRYREPEKGVFNWTPMDQRLDCVQSNGWSLMLTFSTIGPDWAIGPVRNEQSSVFLHDDDFREFLTAFFTRYPNRVAKAQFGNEWQTEYWYAGTAEEYVRFNNILYDVVKEHSPRTQVVLGGFSIGSLQALAALDRRLDYVYDERWQKISGGELEELKQSLEATNCQERIDTVLEQARYDLLDLHLYDDPENWAAYVGMMHARAPDKPIIVSEFGGPNRHLHHQHASSDEFQAYQLLQYLQVLDRLPIREAYFFKPMPGGSEQGAHEQSTLFDEAFNPKPAFEVFQKHLRRQPPNLERK